MWLFGAMSITFLLLFNTFAIGSADCFGPCLGQKILTGVMMVLGFPLTWGLVTPILHSLTGGITRLGAMFVIEAGYLYVLACLVNSAYNKIQRLKKNVKTKL